MDRPRFILIVCEGKTEILYLDILKRQFRLPTYVKVLPEIEEYSPMGQHEKLIDRAAEKCVEYSRELLLPESQIETWAVFDRDNYRGSFINLRKYADIRNVKIAFSDPQFENFLLQHFSQNKSASRGFAVERELSDELMLRNPAWGLYDKSNLGWVEDLVDQKKSVVDVAIRNADVFHNHTRQPFFTVQRLVQRLISLPREY